MYENLSYAQICIRNSQLKGLGGHLKKEAKVPLTVEQNIYLLWDKSPRTTTQTTMVRCNSEQQEDHSF